MNKRIIPIALVVVLLAAAGWFMAGFDRRDEPASNNPQVFNPKKPNFVVGEVTYVDDQVVYFSLGGKIWTISTTGETKFVKQIKDAKGQATTADSSRDELEPRQTVAVYFSSDPINQVYLADKIQIISE